MEITRREIIVSIAIVVLMLTVGAFIGSSINAAHADATQEYETALLIDDTELFDYGMQTSIGNAFVYGNFEVVDPVSYDGVDGQYWWIKKSEQRYTQHQKVVTYTVMVNGKSQTRTRIETYWSWDTVRSESKSCSKVTFLGREFDQNKFIRPNDNHIKTVGAGHHRRNVYYGVPKSLTGTIYTKLSNNTISDKTEIYVNKDLNTTKEDLINFNWCPIFWIGWIILTCILVAVFYYIDNEWLE